MDDKQKAQVLAERKRKAAAAAKKAKQTWYALLAVALVVGVVLGGAIGFFAGRESVVAPIQDALTGRGVPIETLEIWRMTDTAEAIRQATTIRPSPTYFEIPFVVTATPSS